MDRVLTICLGEKESWERCHALEYFEQSATDCDGAEKERYAAVFQKLSAGETICSDTELTGPALKFLREDNELTFCGELPNDRNDPENEHTAIELTLPTGLSEKAWKCWDYFEGTAFAYEYKDRLVVTDEALELTEYGDGSHEAPFGAPRWMVDSWDELEKILEETYDNLEEKNLL